MKTVAQLGEAYDLDDCNDLADDDSFGEDGAVPLWWRPFVCFRTANTWHRRAFASAKLCRTNSTVPH